MEKKERILLDAQLKSVIDQHAFDAELRNGHRIVAFFVRQDMGAVKLAVGDRIQVEMSPYDMSKGQIVVNRGQNDES